MNRPTQNNLGTPVKGESFAFEKYMLFAEHARKNGHLLMADWFEKTAFIERSERMSEEAELAGQVSGNKAVTSLFTAEAVDKKGHGDALKAALKTLKQGTKASLVTMDLETPNSLVAVFVSSETRVPFPAG